MMLTLQQAADRLGKTRRQVRYLIEHGRLPATKRGKQWRIDEDDLPRSAGQQEAARRVQGQIAAAVAETLALPPRSGKRRYSVRDLRAFQIAGPLYHAVARELGAEHAATAALHTVLEELSCGCHRFDHAGKATAYLAARDAASRAACELALLDRADAAAWLECIEQELMAALAGLLRRLDRLNRRRRAHGLPAASAGEASAGAASASAASETADEASTTGASAGRGSAARASR